MSKDIIRQLVPYLFGFEALLGLVVMGLDSYGIQFVTYNVLIYSLVLAICTIIICTYLLYLQKYPKPWHNNLKLTYSLWLFVFWFINLGLVIDLTTSLIGLICNENLDEGIGCGESGTSDATKRYVEPTTSLFTYQGALVAGCVLAALQVILWGITLAIFWMKCHELPPTASEMAAYDIEPRIIRQPLQPTAIRVPLSPDSPRLNPGRASEFTAGAKSSAMTINFDDEIPGLQRIGPEPIIPDDSESEHTLRHVVEDLRRKPRVSGMDSTTKKSEASDSGVDTDPWTEEAEHSIKGCSGIRGIVLSEDKDVVSRMENVPL